VPPPPEFQCSGPAGKLLKFLSQPPKDENDRNCTDNGLHSILSVGGLPTRHPNDLCGHSNFLMLMVGIFWA
jgi:hypothetical protein